jgi:hypothetical protein
MPGDRGWQRAAAKKRMGKTLYVTCARCGAPPGEFCVSKNGREIMSIGMTHNERITPDKKLTKSYRAWM